MLHTKLTHPKSIVVVGGTDHLSSPGGRVLKNLIDSGFAGDLFVINPRKQNVQGQKTFRDVAELPPVDLAIIAIAAKYVEAVVRVLTDEKQARGFIVLSAGFGELDEAGKALEQRIAKKISSVSGSLLGPNNIGYLNTRFAGVFTLPIPQLYKNGAVLVSGSGATAVFIMELALGMGVRFSSVYTLGNSAQIGVEEVLAHLDEAADPSLKPSSVLLYIESLKNPKKFLKHARSLSQKGFRLAAIKSGASEAGRVAASSHTGALASPEAFVDALFNKSGAIRCHSKTELVYVAAVLQQPLPTGKNIGIITHAGGPAVMLSDALSKNGLNVPNLKKTDQELLLTGLFKGSSAINPIDFLATGTPEQLDFILDFAQNQLDELDALAVIFGSPGLVDASPAYDIIRKYQDNRKKPVYAILPSVVNAKTAISAYIQKGKIAFLDEVFFGDALSKVLNINSIEAERIVMDTYNQSEIRRIIEASPSGFLETKKAFALLKLAGIEIVEQFEITCLSQLENALDQLVFPIAMKVIGPLHKTDVGGVALHISTPQDAESSCDKLMDLPDVRGVLIQPMLSGLEVFVGVKAEPGFPHLLVCGMGGIFIETIKDMSSTLWPVGKREAANMIKSLKSYSLLKGVRGQKGISISVFEEILLKVTKLINTVPEISEMDINPLMMQGEDLVAVDVRIRIQH